MGKPSEKPLKLSEDVLKASGGDQPLGATPLELHEASRHHEDAVKEAGGNDDEMTSTTTDSNRKSKILSFVKGGFKGAVKAGISIDKVRAKAGTESAKQRIGVMPKKNQKEVLDLRDFECRFHGKPGIVKLDPDGSVPSISFYEENTSTTEKIGLTDNKGPQLLWTIPINQIMGLMKHSGYGFKSKLFSGWAMDRGMRDSLGISDANGKEYVLTAMPFRDELFNRLCSIGGQTWEVL